MKTLPKAYGGGMLFAASGLDCPTDYENEIVGFTFEPEHGLGFMLYLDSPVQLMAETEIHSEHKVTVDFALNDVMQFRAGGRKISFLATSTDAISGVTAEPFGIDLRFGPVHTNYGDLLLRPGRLIDYARANGHHYVLARRRKGVRIFFGFSHGKTRAQAAAKAEAAVREDIDKLIRERLKFYRRLKPPTGNRVIADTYVKACSILKANLLSPDRSNPFHWSTPDRLPHKMMWIWDTVFHLPGYLRICPGLAGETIKAVFHYQKKDGFIPHMMAPNFESPHTQPPILGWGAMMAYAVTRDKELLEHCYRRNRRFLEWILRNRTNRGGLLGWYINVNQPWCRSGESGMDNSPRFDKHSRLDCVDLCCYVINDIDCMKKMEKALGIRPDGKLAASGEELAEGVKKKLWNARDGFFYDRDPRTGKLSRVRASSGLLPLWAGVATEEQARKCVKHLLNKKEFWTKMPVPSVAIDESSFNRDYWRGAVWVNYNVMITMGLMRYGFRREAKMLARRTVNSIARWHQETGCIYECYDPFDATRPDLLPDRSSRLGARFAEFSTVIRNYGWSSAGFIQLVGFPKSDSI